MITAPRLKSQRLELRDMSLNDAPFVVRLRSDPEVYKYFTAPHKITLEEHTDWFNRRYIYDDNRYDWIGFNDLNEPVGIFGAKRESEKSDCAEISYILDPAYYGKGYAAEAVRAIIAFCKDFWQCRCVTAEIHKDNQSSLKFIARQGFEAVSDSEEFILYKKYL